MRKPGGSTAQRAIKSELRARPARRGRVAPAAWPPAPPGRVDHEALIAVIQRLSLAGSLDEIREVVSPAARQLTGADGATLVLRVGDQCVYADEDAIFPPWNGQRFPIDDCVSGWVMRHRQPVAIPDVYRDSRVPGAAYRASFVKSMAMVPIRETDPVGVIGNYWAYRHEPTDAEISVLQTLATATAVAIDSVRARAQLEQIGLEVIDRLAMAAEYRDGGTRAHTGRVARTSLLLAEAVGLPEPESSLIAQAAPLHDVGKLAVPDAILLKPGRLSAAEFQEVKRHTTIGGAILAGSSSRVLEVAEQIALTHHERWDGDGYPRGLRGEAIPLSGRIVALADVFDALTHERPYKSAWPARAAAAEICRSNGRHFDPRVVTAFMDVGAERLAELAKQPG